MVTAPVSPAGPAAAIAGLLAALCAEHGIAPVPKLEWSRRMRRTLGRAFPAERRIRLSAWLDESQTGDTLRHELAHIAVGASRRARPHGAQWRSWAARLGAEPRGQARNAPALAPPPSSNVLHWGLECTGCGLRLVRRRVLHGLYHRDCGPKRGTLRRVLHSGHSAVLAWAGAPLAPRARC